MTLPELPAVAALTAPAVAAGTNRMPAPFDVVQVRPGHPVAGRDLTSVRLTVHAVSVDGSELDATEWTGGPLLHFLASAVVLVSPPRGAWS